jgi:hypothetical protein
VTSTIQIWDEVGLVARIGGDQGRDAIGLVRRDRLLLEQGELTWSPAQRRRKGAESGPFVVGDHPVWQVLGRGTLTLHSTEEGELLLVELEEGGIFAREEDLVAAVGRLKWENGHIPEVGADGPAIVSLRGTGAVGLSAARGGMPYALHVAEEDGLVTVRLRGLVAWSPSLIPEGVDRLDGEVRIRFSGDGVLWVQTPE